MAKHFVVNDQTLREMYLLLFEMVVKDGKVAAIMSAYNRVCGDYATENRYLFNHVLRGAWGFEGYVQSGFWTTRSCAASLNAGLDHEMPDAEWFNEDNLKPALEDTSTEIELIDRAYPPLHADVPLQPV